MKKRMLAIYLLFAMFITLLPTTALAAETVESGQCGDNLTWTLTSDGVFTVSGTGAMWDYQYYWPDYANPTPWLKKYTSSMAAEPPVRLRKLVIEEGVTHIGECAFMHCADFTGPLTIPATVTSIGNCAFVGCRGFTGPLHIPGSVTEIGNSAFNGCDGLGEIYFDGDAPAVGDTVFPENAELFVPKGGTGWTAPDWNGYTTTWYAPEGDQPEEPPETINVPDGGPWMSAYEDFVLGGGYLQCGQNFGSAIEPVVMLHDMDADGVPELLMTNGEAGRVTRCAYIFTCENDTVQYLGIGPTDAFYIEDSDYTGIWGGFNASPEWNWMYYSKTGLEINSERVYSEVSSVAGSSIEQATGDSVLFNASQKEKTPIYGAVISEIRNIGWGAFVESALGIGFSGEQSSDAELLQIASDLWKEQYNMIWTIPPGAWFQTEWSPDPLEYKGKQWFPVVSSQVSSLPDIQAYWKNYFTKNFAPSEWYLQNYAEINGQLHAANGGIGGDMTLVGFEFDHIISRDDTAVRILVQEKRDDHLDTPQAGNVYTKEFIYTMVWEDDRWKCDDVTYTDGTPFLLRFGVYDVVGTHSIPFDDTLNVDLNWGWELFNKDASEYDHNLAMASLILSRAAYGGSEDAKDKLKMLGFDIISQKYYDEDVIHQPARTVAAQQIYLNGEEKWIITVVVRGTATDSDKLTDVSSCITGFQDSATHVMEDVLSCMLDIEEKYYCTLTKENTIFFLSGHSLGGAVAGILANKALQYAGPENIFTYTFGSPNYDTERNEPTDSKYNGVHNILNTDDPVQNFPWLKKRYGHDWYYDLKNRQGTINYVYGKTGEKSAHDTETYLACLLSGVPENVGDGAVNPYGLSSIHCPVDIVVLDESGMELGRTSGVNVTLSDSSTVLIYTDGDAKYVLAPADVKYTIQFTATGEGVMAYSQQVVDTFSRSTLSSKDFINVELTEGKSMRTEVGGDTDLENIHLFVLDESGKAVAEVAQDGTEISIGSGIPIIGVALVTIILVGCAVAVILVISGRKKRCASESSGKSENHKGI